MNGKKAAIDQRYTSKKKVKYQLFRQQGRSEYVADKHVADKLGEGTTHETYINITFGVPCSAIRSIESFDFVKMSCWRSSVARSAEKYGLTHCPRTLFILNISILSQPKTARRLGSQSISRLFPGFCSSLPLIYTQSALTTCGLESLSICRTADSGSLCNEESNLALYHWN